LRSNILQTVVLSGIFLLVDWNALADPITNCQTHPIQPAKAVELAPCFVGQKAKEARRLVEKAEKDINLHRFVERYSPVVGKIELQAESGNIVVAYQGRPSSADKSGKIPQLIYSHQAGGRIAGYQIPRIDGLPARRELLRFAEVLSQKHPNCRPTWITAEQVFKDETTLWKITAELKDKACPESFTLMITKDRMVVDE
jgi:hypothetical protein